MQDREEHKAIVFVEDEGHYILGPRQRISLNASITFLTVSSFLTRRFQSTDHGHKKCGLTAVFRVSYKP